MTEQEAPEKRDILFIELIPDTMTIKGIEITMSALQILGLAGYLEVTAKAGIMEDISKSKEQELEKPKIEVASMKTPIEL